MFFPHHAICLAICIKLCCIESLNIRSSQFNWSQYRLQIGKRIDAENRFLLLSLNLLVAGSFALGIPSTSMALDESGKLLGGAASTLMQVSDFLRIL